MLKDGKIEHFLGTTIVTAGTDPTSGVQSKDVKLSSKDNVGARIYLPKDVETGGKNFPCHGGAFWTESAWSHVYHKCLSLVAERANVVVVSVNYRLAPEHMLRAAFEDS